MKLITNFVSFILGCCAMRFIAEREWWCVLILLALEAANLFALSRSENENHVKAKVVSLSAYIYVIITDDIMSKGMDTSVRKEIGKTASELPLVVGGSDILTLWMKACTRYRLLIEQKRREKNDKL